MNQLLYRGVPDKHISTFEIHRYLYTIGQSRKNRWFFDYGSCYTFLTAVLWTISTNNVCIVFQNRRAYRTYRDDTVRWTKR